MSLRKYLIDFGILDFKVGDKVIPNPKIFKPNYQMVDGADYAVIRYYDGWTVRVEGNITPFTKLEITLAT